MLADTNATKAGCEVLDIAFESQANVFDGAMFQCR